MNHSCDQLETLELTTLSTVTEVHVTPSETNIQNDDGPRVAGSDLTQQWLDANEAQTAPEGAVSDARPTRRYQVALLVAGFSMIFQIIGINSIYGIFQVGASLHTNGVFNFIRLLDLPIGILHIIGVKHHRCARPRCARLSRGYYRVWTHMGWCWWVR